MSSVVPPVSVRLARPSDLRRIGPVEDTGTALFREHLGDRLPAALTEPAPSGAWRQSVPGALLVAVAERALVGFAHLVWLVDDHGLPAAHLHQLSVRLPDGGRQGTGSALLAAAEDEARWADHDRLTLTTYRDLPWNGPFYARRGYDEVADVPRYLQVLRDQEAASGLDAAGARVVMAKSLRR